MANDKAIQERIRKLEEQKAALASEQRLSYSMDKANRLRQINQQINKLTLQMMPR